MIFLQSSSQSSQSSGGGGIATRVREVVRTMVAVLLHSSGPSSNGGIVAQSRGQSRNGSGIGTGWWWWLWHCYTVVHLVISKTNNQQNE